MSKRSSRHRAESCVGEESFLEDITGPCHCRSPAVGPGPLLGPRPVPWELVTLSTGALLSPVTSFRQQDAVGVTLR